MSAFDGFREFVQTHTGAWSRLAYVLVGNHAAAEDLLQTALLKTAKRWGRIQGYEQPEEWNGALLHRGRLSVGVTGRQASGDGAPGRVCAIPKRGRRRERTA